MSKYPELNHLFENILTKEERKKERNILLNKTRSLSTIESKRNCATTFQTKKVKSASLAY